MWYLCDRFALLVAAALAILSVPIVACMITDAVAFWIDRHVDGDDVWERER